MELSQRINAFAQLGKFLSEFTEAKEWKDYSNGVSKADFDEFNELVELPKFMQMEKKYQS